MPNQQVTSDPLQSRSQLSGSVAKSQNSLAKSLQGGDQSGIISALGSWSQGVGSVLNLSTVANKTVSQDKLAIRNGISDFMVSTPGMVGAGLALKAVDAIGDLTGYHLDDIDEDAAYNAGISSSASKWSNVLNAVPALGTLISPFVKKTNETSKSINDYGKNVLASYLGVEKDVRDAKTLSGKRTIAGKDTINDFINSADMNAIILNEIGRTNTLAKRNSIASDIAQQTLNRFAGTNYNTYAIGKKGMKIMSRSELQNILAKRKYQNGGVIGVDSNILPEGALHARLNHLQDVNPDLEDTTRKGIPVLDGNGEQVAEIENSELVLRLEITKKIEELMKDGSEEAMIEAGKILVDEIIDNTQDNTGKITEDEN